MKKKLSLKIINEGFKSAVTYLEGLGYNNDDAKLLTILAISLRDGFDKRNHVDYEGDLVLVIDKLLSVFPKTDKLQDEQEDYVDYPEWHNGPLNFNPYDNGYVRGFDGIFRSTRPAVKLPSSNANYRK